ncbi:hypothetical protein V3C99_013673 [Haemonchus contortus]
MGAHVSQQNEDLGNEVSRLQPISDARSPPAQETRSPFDLRATSSRGARLQGGGTTETLESQSIETLPRRKRNVWTESELGRLANLVERHRTANGGVQWAELGSAWESSRNTQDPKRTVKALQAAYAKLTKLTERAESIVASEDLAERRTPSRNSSPQQGSEITVSESQQDEGEENPGHQVFGEVASLQYNIESSEGTAEIENQSPEGNSQELPFDGTREPQPNDDPVTMESRTRSRRRRRDAVELVHPSSDDDLLTRNSIEALEIQQEGGTVLPTPPPQQSLQSRRSPIRENGDDHQNRRVQRTKDVIWTTNELAKLAFMVERHRDPDGRIRWADLRSTWDCSRMENDPRRTLSALKAAYAKIARLTDRNEAPRSETSNNEHEDEEQPAESNIGEPVTLINQEHTSLSDRSETGDSTETRTKTKGKFQSLS